MLNGKSYLTELLLLLICSTLSSLWIIFPKFCLQIYSFTLSCSKGINIVIKIWLLCSPKFKSTVHSPQQYPWQISSRRRFMFDMLLRRHMHVYQTQPKNGLVEGGREAAFRALRCQNDAAYWEQSCGSSFALAI